MAELLTANMTAQNEKVAPLEHLKGAQTARSLVSGVAKGLVCGRKGARIKEVQEKPGEIPDCGL